MKKIIYVAILIALTSCNQNKSNPLAELYSQENVQEKVAYIEDF